MIKPLGQDPHFSLKSEKVIIAQKAVFRKPFSENRFSENRFLGHKSLFDCEMAYFGQ